MVITNYYQLLISYYQENFIDRYKENNDYYLQKRAEQNLSETIQNVVDMGIKLPVYVQDLFASYLVGQDSADSDHEQEVFSDDETLAQEFMQICEDAKMSLISTSTLQCSFADFLFFLLTSTKG